MENVVTAIFDVESEAYKAFSEIRAMPFGNGYGVAEAALLKREGDNIIVVDSIDAVAVTADDTAAGMVIGSLVGILGGPFGVLLGAATGALIGSSLDSADAVNSLSMMEVTAAKLYDGEIAIIALVQEEEPAFDAAFEDYQTTIIRHFAVDVINEVDLARDAQADLANQMHEQLRAERKAERADKREERSAKVKAHFEEIKAKRAARKATAAEAREIAEAQFTSSTKEMLGTE
ncbi:MAG: DUF1269 domain-containing protein [Coriobacteriales bacterium]|nr:DUF1269 domain-containing protein [Coriobacteriales bacterium]